MRYYEVIPNVVARMGSGFFTYQSTDELQIGQIVKIPIGKKEAIGVVYKPAKKPDFDTKEILSVIYEEPLPESLLNLAVWMSNYYQSELAVCIKTLLPSGIEKKRRTPGEEDSLVKKKEAFTLNKEQARIVNDIIDSQPKTHLLHGITGSGKTAIYIEIAKKMASLGKSTIVLVPEIALSSQLKDEFSSRLENVIFTHSNQTEATRHKIWETCLKSDKPTVIIGPRSTLFMPIKKLGAIVVDEAHEPSFKQESQPRYSALRAASVLGKQTKSQVIFGSATPLVSDYYLADKNKAVLNLDKLAKRSIKPEITVVDLKDRSVLKRHHFLSNKLLSQIEKNLANSKQTLLFHNRRGSASVTRCDHCGWFAICKKCFVPLVLHVDKFKLICHICDTNYPVPTNCPNCSNTKIVHRGIGTKLVETEIEKLFPKARILRLDGDSSIHDFISTDFDKLKAGEFDIIIGTQIIAKGFDLPHLATVGIIQADAGLYLPDYGAAERVFQLVYQAVGRIGRNDQETNAVVQSYAPEHPSIKFGATQNYQAFYDHSVKQRQKQGYPPFCFLLKATCTYKTEAAAIKNAVKITKEIKRLKSHNIVIYGPAPSFYERKNNYYRWQITIKTKKREDLIALSQLIPKNNWQIELDPLSLL